MKKILMLSLLSVLFVGFSSCSNDDDDAPFLGANVDVTVKNMIGTLQKNETVYMYKNKEVTDSTKIEDAAKKIVTDENGVAKFSLNLTELDILESQTTLYFAVFYKVGDKTFVAGNKGITVKRNESKQVEITIPI